MRPPRTRRAIGSLALVRHAMDALFGGRPEFRCCWTYVNCRRP